MINTEIVKGSLPFRITINGLCGAGRTPAGAVMAALSVGGKIPKGTRSRKKAAAYILDTYPIDRGWIKLIHILEDNKFNMKGGKV